MLIEFDPDAEAEYAETVAWYSKQSPATAIRFEDAVQSAIATIMHDPKRFPLDHAACRRCSLRPFPLSLIFKELNGVIKIFAVAHVKRRADYWWRRV